LETLSDNELMQNVQNGDIDKMGLLYERHNRHLYRFLYNMTRQKELSEDLVQNIFMRMLRYHDGFRGHGEFRTWMYRVARNMVYDHFKKAGKTPAHTDVSAYETRIEGDHHADSGIVKAEELRLLESAMEMLSIENRELLVLCRYQELKYSEIATILNITEGAVKVRIHRALSQLKNNYLRIDN